MLKAREIAIVRKLYEDTQTPIEDICRMFKISRMTLWRYVKNKPQ
ncbi:MAG: helix-turn-helix domain-containing protein [Acetobacteraceae bacterium]|nr:helix-turn-helix domain-containing protein [Acetobacteraceae bacterium]MBV8578981.1 helix-turn-helix domain-containing protein [Acetobacteraceae bacterium]